MNPESFPSAGVPRRVLSAALFTGGGFALVGILIHLRSLAETTLPAILAPGTSITFREIVEGLPVPKLVDWSLWRIDQLIDLRDMGDIPRYVFGSLLFGSLWLLAVSILNPTFRLFTRIPVSPLRPEVSRLPEEKIDRVPSTPTEAVEPLETPPASDMPDEEEVPESVELLSTDPFPDTRDPKTPLGNSAPGEANSALTLWALDRVHLEQAVRFLLLIGIPLLLVWLATGGLSQPATLHLVGKSEAFNRAWGDAVRCLALGIGLWLGFHPEGVAGSFGILHQVYQSDELLTPGRDRPNKAAWGKLFVIGLLFGVGLYLLLRLSMPPPSPEVIADYRALGTFTQTYWNEIALHYLGNMALVWFGIGVWLYVLGRSGLRFGTRAALLLIPVGAAVAASALARPYALSALAARFDATPAVLATAPANPRYPGYGVPNGPQAGQELAQRLHLKTVSAPIQTRNMIVFHPIRNTITSLGDYSEDGIRVDADSVRRVEAYLKQHHYESALSWTAVKYLYSDAAMRFDITSGIRVCLEDMERAPHLVQCNDTTRALLFVCAASPQNHALLDTWADESRFAHTDRASQAMMGDLYLRFGEKEKALAWYRKAEMPRSFLASIRAQQPLFHQGRVTGRLLLNGKPVSGVQVGIVPHRLNGLPKDLESPVLGYGFELTARRPYSELFPARHPRPFALRWISEGAVTGADGSFTLDNLTEGEYYLVCTLPSEVQCTVSDDPDMPPDPALQIVRAPRPFTLNYTNPSQNVGDIVLTYKK